MRRGLMDTTRDWQLDGSDGGLALMAAIDVRHMLRWLLNNRCYD